MPLISDLTRREQRTVARLVKDKDVAVDRITGLFESIKEDFYKENPNATGIDWKPGTATVNGSVPPGQPFPIQSENVITDEITGDQQVRVFLGTRKAGTRAGIHVHESGGLTFVVGGKGRVTDFVEGFPNAEYPVGSYYFMPSNIPMSAADLTDKNVRLMDIFVTPVGQPFITFIEPGYPPV